MDSSFRRLPIALLLSLALPLAALGSASPNRASAQDEVPGPAEPAPATPAPPSVPPLEAPPPAAGALTARSCDRSALILSRPFIARNGEVEWWAVGFAPGTFPGVRLVDPTGRTALTDSATVDNLCEASGVLLAENRLPGAYLLTVAGTRAGGGPVELSAQLNIVSLTRPTTTALGPTPAPLPAPPGGVRATALNHNTVRVEWADNSDNELGFRIDGEAGQFRTAPNVTNSNVGGLQPLSIYCFSVYAFNAAGESFGGTSCASTPAGPGTR